MLKPMVGYGLHVVCYDIANDQRRRRVVRELEAFGVRVQESVFECWVDDLQRQRLEQALLRAIHQEDDRIVCYCVERSPKEEALVLGSQLSSDQGCVLI
jgi:CRISPR-associated protein Cas2